MKYSDTKLTLIDAWAREGLSDAQISTNLGVNVTTFNYWKRTRPELALLLEKAREPIIREVENALYKRAIGYKFTEVNVERSRRKKIIKKTLKEVPPDVKAIIFYLTNRVPSKWKFSSKIETGPITDPEGEMDLSKLSDEKLALLEEAIRESHGITDED